MQSACNTSPECAPNCPGNAATAKLRFVVEIWMACCASMALFVMRGGLLGAGDLAAAPFVKRFTWSMHSFEHSLAHRTRSHRRNIAMRSEYQPRVTLKCATHFLDCCSLSRSSVYLPPPPLSLFPNLLHANDNDHVICPARSICATIDSGQQFSAVTFQLRRKMQPIHTYNTQIMKYGVKTARTRSKLKICLLSVPY